MGPRPASALLLAVFAGGTLGMAACGDDDEASSADTASQYADALCSAGLGWMDDIELIKADLSPEAVVAQADPLVYVRQTVEDAVTAARQLAERIEDATPPDTDVGREVSQVFEDTSAAVATSFDEAAITLEADPPATDVLDVVSTVAADVSAAAQEAGAALREVQASDPSDNLSDALEASPSCEELRSRSS